MDKSERKVERLVFGLARQIVGSHANEFLHDVAYWHWKVASLKQLTDDQWQTLVELLQFWEDKVADGRDEHGRVVAF